MRNAERHLAIEAAARKDDEWSRRRRSLAARLVSPGNPEVRAGISPRCGVEAFMQRLSSGSGGRSGLIKPMHVPPSVVRIAVGIALVTGAGFSRAARSAPADVVLATPTPPPAWALAERALFRANAAACREFYSRYFDRNGYLLCVERWGGNDGPDDAIENVNDWPLLYALGGDEEIRALYHRAWEGHLRQYTLAKTIQVPLARDGMYYKEFPTQMDWVHNGEGLTAFTQSLLSDGQDPRLIGRLRRFAGFYVGDDPGAKNYDPNLHLIRSMFNGSRGPLLRKATAQDWAGDPIEVENRFRARHGERNYREMLAHFKDYNDVIGDHPLNMLSTSLVASASAATGDAKYRQWILEYVDGWRERMAQNRGIIPTNVGLDGRIGSAAGGKWYGGVYGWGFSVIVPQSGEIAHRNQHQAGFVGMENAYLLTGKDAYLDAWRKQADAVNAARKMQDGQWVYPRMYGDQGWYDFHPTPYQHAALDIWNLSERPEDLARAPDNGWLQYLAGKNPNYPLQALQGDLGRIRTQVAGMRADDTTPDTRLADDPLIYNPASVNSLVHLTLGGLHSGNKGALLHCRLRYFDPEARRPGLPDDVAALVESISPGSVTVSLVNTSVTDARTVTIQSGAYAEHRFTEMRSGDNTRRLDARAFAVHLPPGCGGRIELRMRRHVAPPTSSAPWARAD